MPHASTQRLSRGRSLTAGLMRTVRAWDHARRRLVATTSPRCPPVAAFHAPSVPRCASSTRGQGSCCQWPRLALAPRRQYGGSSGRSSIADSAASTTASSTLSPRLREQLGERLRRYEELVTQASSPSLSDDGRRRVMAEMGRLEAGAIALQELRALESEVQELRSLEADPTAEDELKLMASAELEAASATIESLEQSLLQSLLPKDDADDGAAIVEIRAGTGGDEASIFAADLYEMYSRAGTSRGWQLEQISCSLAETGSGHTGYKEIVARVSGQAAFAKLRFESGVHRVQRVPTTETKGRVHTSTASVVIMPEPTEVSNYIDPKDLRIDVYRASGAGGQHVNTTESAVRITHVPTGIQAAIQDERSQHQNRAKALVLVAARVYEQRRAEEDQRLSAERQSQIGSGDRSERIRTYNLMQNRVTDHRIGLTVHGMEDMLAGGDTFTAVCDGLREQHLQDQLAALEL